MRKFFNRQDEEELEELQEEELDIINLDETAEWSKLEVAAEAAKQQAVNLMEEIGDELAILDVVEEDVKIEELAEDGLEIEILSPITQPTESPEQNASQMQYHPEEETGETEVELEYLSGEDGEEETDYFSVDEEEEEEYEEGFFASFIENLSEWFSKWTTMDKIIAVSGVLVVMVAVLVAGMYAGKRGANKQMEAFAPVGEQLETIGVVGSDKLLAVANAKKAFLEAAKLEEELNQVYEEEELTTDIKVVMKMTSVQKDLKIKFVNKKTGKLVGNIPFEVEITDSENKKYNKIDEDKDGVIYLTDLTPGNYSVAMVELSGAEGYSFSTASEKIKVKETIAYEKIDVSDEILDQSQVNAATEDTAQKTETESTLTDTVEWVESTKTEASSQETYTKVSKDTIADPALSASLNLDLGILRVMQQSLDSQEGVQVYTETGEGESISGNNPGNSNPSEVAVTGVTLGETSKSLSVGDSAVLTVTVLPEDATDKTVTWSSSDSSVVSVSEGTITAQKAGSADIMVTTANGNYTASCKVTVTAKTVNVTAVSLNKTSLSLTAGNSEALTVTITPAEATNKNVVWKSSSEAVATVDTTGNVTAKAAGTAQITVTTEDGGKSASCTITVTAAYDPKTDTTKALKDKSGNQLYVLENDSYREARVADYYKYDAFYKKENVSKFTYTGWQNIDGKTYYYDKNGNYVTGEQVIQGAKYSFNSDGSLNNGSGVLGIDVSTWNGNIDWTKVKNSGVSYAIIRTGFRGSTQGSLVEDNKFRKNIQGATNAGLKVGVYFFSQAVNEVEAVEEASMVLSQIKGYKITYPVFIDVEPSNGRADSLSADARTRVINAFCQTIQNGGYRAGIYANKTWLNSKMNVSALSGYKIWLAQYNSTVTYGGRYDMWQYSSKGSVSGISGNVDMNLSYMSY